MTTQPEFNPQQPLTYFDALQILQIVKSTGSCALVRLRFGGMTINLERVSIDAEMAVPASLPATDTGMPMQPSPSAVPTVPTVHRAQAPNVAGDRQAAITAPMVGFFHSCSDTVETRPVRVGDRVNPADTVGMIKAMAISKPILAGVAGRVTEILVADAAFVEYGQPLLRVDQSGS